MAAIGYGKNGRCDSTSASNRRLHISTLCMGQLGGEQEADAAMVCLHGHKRNRGLFPPEWQLSSCPKMEDASCRQAGKDEIIHLNGINKIAEGGHPCCLAIHRQRLGQGNSRRVQGGGREGAHRNYLHVAWKPSWVRHHVAKGRHACHSSLQAALQASLQACNMRGAASQHLHIHGGCKVALLTRGVSKAVADLPKRGLHVDGRIDPEWVIFSTTPPAHEVRVAPGPLVIGARIWSHAHSSAWRHSRAQSTHASAVSAQATSSAIAPHASKSTRFAEQLHDNACQGFANWI